MTQRISSADVVVVGGGIVGCAVAYFLARSGATVELVEAEDVGSQQSSQNGGWVRLLGRARAELELMLQSRRLWNDLEAELETPVDWVQAGSIRLASDSAELQLLQDWLETAGGSDQGLQIVDGAEVTRLIPSLRQGWMGGLVSTGDGHADPVKATRAFAMAAQRCGTRLRTRAQVHQIILQAGRVSGVRTTSGLVTAGTVVCAAGVGSSRLLRTCGLDLPLRVVRSTMIRTAAVPHVTQMAVWSPGVAFRQTPSGHLTAAAGIQSDYDITLESLRHMGMFLGNYWKNRRSIRFHIGRPLIADLASVPKGLISSRPVMGTLPSPAPINTSKVAACLEELSRVLPDLGRPQLEMAWAGYIDATPDALPVLSQTAEVPGLVIATGFSGHGFGLAPAAAMAVCDLVLNRTPAVGLSSFRFARFSERDLGKSRALI